MKKIGFKCVTLSLLATIIAFAGYGYAKEPAIDFRTIAILESVRQNYYAHERLESLRNNNSVNINRNVSASVWLRKVKASDVNMVTNRFTGNQQEAVHINGKIYFAAGDGYILNLKENSASRFAKDPVTNRTIDKADAVLYSDAFGRILYFESDMSFERFVGMANSKTLYGYSR